MTDLTLVLNAHREGCLVHRTVRSALRSIEHARKRGISVEFLAVVDRPDAETGAYFERHRGAFDDVLVVDEGDLGLARNCGAERSRGECVAFLDGDDLLGRAWLYLASAHQARQGPGAIVHPEWAVGFEGERWVWRMFAQSDPRFRYEDLVEQNHWIATALARRAVFLQLPYAPTPAGSGFGFEDFHWNCEAIGRGYRHHVAPGTVYFRRVKGEGSLLEAQRAESAVPRPSTLFDPEAWERLTTQAGYAALGPRDVDRAWGDRRRDGSLRRGLSRLERSSAWGARAALALRRCGRLGASALRATLASLRSAVAPLQLPPWLVEEWEAVRELEPNLHGSACLRSAQQVLRRERVHTGKRYLALARAFESCASHVLLVPRLEEGGADPAALHYANALERAGLARGVVVIATEATASPPGRRPAAGIRLVEFGRLAAGLDERGTLTLLLKLLLQMAPGCIHNFDSPLGWELLVRHGRALASRARLFATLSGRDRDGDGDAAAQLPRCFEQLTALTADHQRVLDRLEERFGLDPARMFAQCQPVGERSEHAFVAWLRSLPGYVETAAVPGAGQLPDRPEQPLAPDSASASRP